MNWLTYTLDWLVLSKLTEWLVKCPVDSCIDTVGELINYRGS